MVKRNPIMFEPLACLWKDHHKIVRAAVENDGRLIKWASERLRSDESLVKLAGLNDPTGEFYRHITPEAQRNKKVALLAVKNNGALVKEMEVSLRRDRDIIFSACINYPALPLADETLVTDQNFSFNVVQHCMAVHIGPNLHHYVFDDAFLSKVVQKTAEENIFLCRITLLSGKSVLTSFCVPAMQHINWRRHCLGLDRLFPAHPEKIYTVCRNEYAEEADWEAWSSSLTRTAQLGLALHEINDIHLVAQ